MSFDLDPITDPHVPGQWHPATYPSERRPLEHMESFLASIVESSDDSIIGTDLEGRIVSWNRGAQRLFGYTPQEVIGRPIAVLFAAGHQDDYHHSLETMRSQGQIERFEAVRVAKGGTLIEVAVILSPIRAAGQLIGVSAIYRDITRRKLVEAQLLRAKDAAEAASRAKSQFLNNISHELLTPMNCILGMTEAVLDTDLSEEQREYLGFVRDAAKGLQAIIHSTLDFSALEANNLQLSVQKFDPRELVAKTLDEFSPAATEKGLALIVRVRPEIPEMVRGDAARVRQVLLHLLTNAIKFTATGSVAILVGPVPESSGTLHFSVTDTGPGIPPDRRGAIFLAFTQLDGSLTRNAGGTGLGLTVATRLVELMGGRIWVESDGHSGSTFHFTVPEAGSRQ